MRGGTFSSNVNGNTGKVSLTKNIQTTAFFFNGDHYFFVPLCMNMSNTNRTTSYTI